MLKLSMLKYSVYQLDYSLFIGESKLCLWEFRDWIDMYVQPLKNSSGPLPFAKGGLYLLSLNICGFSVFESRRWRLFKFSAYQSLTIKLQHVNCLLRNSENRTVKSGWEDFNYLKHVPQVSSMSMRMVWP